MYSSANKEVEFRSVADVKRFLDEEVVNCDKFARELFFELKEIQDLKANLNLFERQMESIEKIVAKRDHMMSELLMERRKGFLSDDLTIYQNQVQMIVELDRELNSLISKMYEELSKLFISRTHKIYNESTGSRETMHQIDKRAREIHAKLEFIHLHLSSYQNHMAVILTDLQNIEKDRRIRSIPPKAGVGFNV